MLLFLFCFILFFLSCARNRTFLIFFFFQDFDQPLYTNGQSFLCPESDVACPERTCKACDWSGQEVSSSFLVLVLLLNNY